MSADSIGKALRRAFNLGQQYWQQADSDSYKQNAKSHVTRDLFDELVTDTIRALPSAELERDAAEREKSNRWAAGLAATNIAMVGEIVEHLRDFRLGFLDGHELATALQMMLDRQNARAKEATR